MAGKPIDLDEGRGDRMTMAEARAATEKPPAERDRAYVLMPAWLAALTDVDGEFDEGLDPPVSARWFSADGWVWHVLFYDRDWNSVYAFVTSPHAPDGEFGMVEVAELEAARTVLGLPAVERDLLKETPYPLSSVTDKIA